jgi:putative membrane protein
MRVAYPLVLLASVVAVLAWSAIDCFDTATWLLEVAPAVLGLVILLFTWRRFPLTPLLSTLIALHMVILAVGGHYTYALTPAGDWIKDWLHLSRNHYDRLGHFAQGFVPAMIARELFLRLGVVGKHGWRNFLIVCVCMTVSAIYELLEWSVALTIGEKSDSFLGTQGDVWDTQTDMFLALVGACLALLLLSRWHDRQLVRLNNWIVARALRAEEVAARAAADARSGK